MVSNFEIFLQFFGQYCDTRRMLEGNQRSTKFFLKKRVFKKPLVCLGNYCREKSIETNEIQIKLLIKKL
jgi:hypothetical protein